jgi:hypothetical protein
MFDRAIGIKDWAGGLDVQIILCVWKSRLDRIDGSVGVCTNIRGAPASQGTFHKSVRIAPVKVQRIFVSSKMFPLVLCPPVVETIVIGLGLKSKPQSRARHRHIPLREECERTAQAACIVESSFGHQAFKIRLIPIFPIQLNLFWWLYRSTTIRDPSATADPSRAQRKHVLGLGRSWMRSLTNRR